MPTLANFIIFVQNVMGIGAAYLPTTSAFLTYVFNFAMNTVNDDMGQLDSLPGSFSIYELAVYNLAGHQLIEFGQDISYALSTLSWSNGTATATTSTAHAIVAGDNLVISGVSPNPWNGPCTATSILSSTQFTFPKALNPGAATIFGSVAETFFVTARKNFRISSFVPGSVESAADHQTSNRLLNPHFFSSLMLGDLQLMKTPYGRHYLSLAQKYGPTIWGMS